MTLTTEQIHAYLVAIGGLMASYGLQIMGALAILIAGWIAAGWIKRSLRRALDRTDKIDPTLKPLIASVVRYAVLIFVVVAVLHQFGVQTASIIAALGAIGLAIGLALQGTLSNIAAGVMLLFLRPFEVGDYVDAEGTAGTVLEIGLFTTQMETFDGVFVSVPNAQIWNRSVRNYSRLPNRRVDIQIGISYGDDIAKASTALLDLMTAESRILDEPAEPQVLVLDLADSAVILNMRFWCRRQDYWDVLFEMRRRAKDRMDAEGITIPFPQRDVHLYPTGEPTATD